MVTNILIFLSVLFFIVSVILAILAARREGMLTFLTTAHYVSLIIIILGSVTTWIALTWMTSPKKFNVKPRQKLALVFSILLGIFFWGRFIFTIQEDSETYLNN